MNPAYLEGYAAFRAGVSVGFNPYPEQQVDHFDWNDGWLDAEHEAEIGDGP